MIGGCKGGTAVNAVAVKTAPHQPGSSNEGKDQPASGQPVPIASTLVTRPAFFRAERVEALPRAPTRIDRPDAVSVVKEHGYRTGSETIRLAGLVAQRVLARIDRLPEHGLRSGGGVTRFDRRAVVDVCGTPKAGVAGYVYPPVLARAIRPQSINPARKADHHQCTQHRHTQTNNQCETDAAPMPFDCSRSAGHGKGLRLNTTLPGVVA